MRLARRLRSFIALYRLSSQPALRRHPGRFLLIVCAIAIGTGSVVATGSLIESALASFEASIRKSAGKGDLRVSNGFVGVSDELLGEVAQVPGVGGAGAILVTSARLRSELRSTDLVLIGVDLLGGDSVHGASDMRSSIESGDEADFVARADAIALSGDWARTNGVAIGSELQVSTRAGLRTLYVAGLIRADSATAIVGGAYALMDLPALQALLRRAGMVDAIDVTVAPGSSLESVRDRIAARVAGSATVFAIGNGEDAFGSLLFNARLILNLAGSIAIIVSFLVIFHAVSLVVSQREAEISVVRSIGASRKSVLAMFMGEALALGCLGGVVGLALGVGLAWLAQSLFLSSVTTLYAPLTSGAFRVSQTYLVIGLILSLFVTALATASAAWAAHSLGSGLRVASPRSQRLRRVRRAAFTGVLLIAFSLVLLPLETPALSVQSLILIATAADVLLLAGIALLAPAALLVLAPLAERLVRRSRSALARVALQGLTSDPGRTATVLSSMLVGLSYVVVTVAVVGSLEAFVFRWVDHSFRADLTVSAAGHSGVLPSAPPLSPSLEETIRRHPAVAQVEAVRVVLQPFRDRWVVIASRPTASLGTTYPVRVVDGDLKRARSELQELKSVVVSSHFTEKFNLGVDDEVELRTPAGKRSFRIVAVVEDFLSDLGTIFVDPAAYRTPWRDESVSSFHVWIRDGASLSRVKEDLAKAVESECDCSVMTGAEFRRGFNVMVNAAFQTAYALELVACVVMVVSVASFFALSLGERRREIEGLRAIGASRSQLVRCFLLEAVSIGILGGVLGCVAGVLVSYRLVRTTMHASGGLTLDYVLPIWSIPGLIAGAVLLSVASSVVPVLTQTRSRLAGFNQTLD